MEKDFNTYKEGLDLEVLHRYCMKHGTEKIFLRGESLESEGHLSHWLGFVVQGCFKYIVHNDVEQKDYTLLTV